MPPRRIASLVFIVPLLLLVAAASGCGLGTRINPEALRGPVERVVARHDRYVDRDPGLSPDTKAMFKSQSQTLQVAVDTTPSDKGIDAASLEPVVKSVTSRHDAYLLADTSVLAVERSVWLRDALLLRRVFDAALGRPPETPVPLPR